LENFAHLAAELGGRLEVERRGAGASPQELERGARRDRQHPARETVGVPELRERAQDLDNVSWLASSATARRREIRKQSR